MNNSTRSICCDTCGKELVVDSHYPKNYGLELSCKNFGYNSSNMEYSILQRPIIKCDCHFCSLRCLKDWAVKTIDD